MSLELEGLIFAPTKTKKDGKKMPKYTYKFCDGTVNEVEVSDEHYALLKKLDKQEREKNRQHKRHSAPLKAALKKPDDKGAN